VQALARYDALPHVRQPEAGINYAHKIEKAEASINWCRSAADIARQVRAFNPFPGASTQLGTEPLKIWQCTVEQDSASTSHVAPGTVVFANPERGIGIQTGHGILVATELQRPGGKRMQAADFLRGHALEPGLKLG
jgi:methionyl-tRNA formyltransferase